MSFFKKEKKMLTPPDRAKKYSGGLKSFITGHFVLSFLLLFIVLGMLAELVLAIVNYMFSNGGGYSSYIIPIVIMPAVAACVAGIIMYITYRNTQTGNRLAEGFDKVSHGEFGYQLEVPRRGNMKQVFIDFNKMSTELKSIQALKDEFIHDFSHEFKTPIASINGFANLLLEGGLTPEEEKQYLRIISDESARLSALAENTLMLNRLENQQFVGEVHPYRLDLQLKECIILLEHEWAAKDISINSELEPVEYEGNANLLQQVWLNLLSNAVKFTPQHGEIGVNLKADGAFVEVRVSDTGIGMSREVASHVFDKYYQGDASHSTRGNGLGLAIVKRIVTLSGGRVSVESEEGAGSTFIVKLPM